MTGVEKKTKYYIFKCRNIACKEIITVKFFSPRKNSSYEIPSIVHQNARMNENMGNINISCPSCMHMYHFQIDEGIKEIC